MRSTRPRAQSVGQQQDKLANASCITLFFLSFPLILLRAVPHGTEDLIEKKGDRVRGIERDGKGMGQRRSKRGRGRGSEGEGRREKRGRRRGGRDGRKCREGDEGEGGRGSYSTTTPYRTGHLPAGPAAESKELSHKPGPLRPLLGLTMCLVWP